MKLPKLLFVIVLCISCLLTIRVCGQLCEAGFGPNDFVPILEERVLLSDHNSPDEMEAIPDSLVQFQKNTIYATNGTFWIGDKDAWIGQCLNLNYERQVYVTDNRFLVTYYAKAGFGLYSDENYFGPYSSLSVQAVFGHRKWHLELGLGVAAVLDESDFEDAVAAAGEPQSFGERVRHGFNHTNPFLVRNIGYRRQKPGGWFLFRVGVGVPDGAYFSIGASF